MGGMMRLKNEQELADLVKRSNLRIAGQPQRAVIRQAVVPAIEAAAQTLTAKVAERRGRSELEIELQRQIEAAGLPTPTYDVPYLIGSRHRMDVLWVDRRCGVEVQGNVHRIKGRFKADMEKRALGLLQGWAILEVGGDEIRSGKAMEWIRALLNMHPPK